MLHALLHRKLDETVPEPQRFEDALTSTVFGTLAMVGAADVLAAWLSLARQIDGSRLPVEGPLNGAWFWPRSRPRTADRELNCQLYSSVQPVKLYDLDGSGAIEKLAADIRAYWQKHTTVTEE